MNEETGKDAEKAQKRKRKKKKKKRKEIVEEVDDDITDYEIDPAISFNSSQLLKVEDLPEHLRYKYANYEAHPLNIFCQGISPSITIEELRSYFNTLIS